VRPSVVVPVLAVLAAVLVGCSGPTLSATASEELTAHVDALRAAVAEEDSETAHRKLAELRTALGDYEDSGEVDADRAASIRAVIDEVEELLAFIEDDTELAEADAPEADASEAEASADGGGGGSDGEAQRGGGPPDDRPGKGKGRDRGGGPNR
jgi:uncharacterized membrane protein